MINTELDYVKLRCNADGEVYYFAADNLRFKRLENEFKDKRSWVPGVAKLKTLEQIFKERGGYEIEDTIKGAQMVGWEYRGPFDELPAQSMVGGYPFTDEIRYVSGVTAHKVIDGGRDSHGGPVVVAGEGTGIVHSAPGSATSTTWWAMKLACRTSPPWTRKRNSWISSGKGRKTRPWPMKPWKRSSAA
jgi:isoleucyl-tRNA synthetase